jgi:hypothetical protein
MLWFIIVSVFLAIWVAGGMISALEDIREQGIIATNHSRTRSRD